MIDSVVFFCRVLFGRVAIIRMNLVHEKIKEFYFYDDRFFSHVYAPFLSCIFGFVVRILSRTINAMNERVVNRGMVLERILEMR